MTRNIQQNATVALLGLLLWLFLWRVVCPLLLTFAELGR